MSSNVEIFEKIIFSIPDSRKLLASSAFLSLIYSGLVISAVNLFSSFSPSVGMGLVLAVLGFFLPFLFSGELFYRFLPDYPRHWGYFLALVNMSIFFVYGLIITGADGFGEAWRIFWLALTTVYASNLLVLLLTLGYRHLPRISVLSLIQPVSVLIFFHLILGARSDIGILGYLSGLLVVVVAAVLVVLTIFVAEYLIKSNVRNVSVIQLTAGLLQKNQEALDIGYPTNPDVQTLQIENEGERINLAAPWVHPGPLEGFGGGKVSSDMIEDLNAEDWGFFLHVPSTHKSDPADPEDYKNLVEAVEEPEKIQKASKLVSKDYDRASFFGRKVGDKKIVFMDAKMYDYEVSIFREILNLDDILLVDLHCHDRDEEEGHETWYNTKDARHLRDCIIDFLEYLDKREQSEYKAGFNVDTEGTPITTLVEEVDGQKTLLIGLEGNGLSKDVRELKEDYSDNFDEVLAFSTDTHQSIHELSDDKQVETDRIRNSVDQSKRNLASASIGLTNSQADTMRLLQEDYMALIFSINILIRLMILLLIAVYIWLIGWVFL